MNLTGMLVILQVICGILSDTCPGLFKQFKKEKKADLKLTIDNGDLMMSVRQCLKLGECDMVVFEYPKCLQYQTIKDEQSSTHVQVLGLLLTDLIWPERFTMGNGLKLETSASKDLEVSSMTRFIWPIPLERSPPSQYYTNILSRENIVYPSKERVYKASRKHVSNPPGKYVSKPSRKYMYKPSNKHESKPPRKHVSYPARKHESKISRKHVPKSSNKHVSNPSGKDVSFPTNHFVNLYSTPYMYTEQQFTQYTPKVKGQHEKPSVGRRHPKVTKEDNLQWGKRQRYTPKDKGQHGKTTVGRKQLKVTKQDKMGTLQPKDKGQHGKTAVRWKFSEKENLESGNLQIPSDKTKKLKIKSPRKRASHKRKRQRKSRTKSRKQNQGKTYRILDNVCVYLDLDAKVSWSDARELCAVYGQQHLITLASKKKFDAFKRFFEKTGYDEIISVGLWKPFGKWKWIYGGRRFYGSIGQVATGRHMCIAFSPKKVDSFIPIRCDEPDYGFVCDVKCE